MNTSSNGRTIRIVSDQISAVLSSERPQVFGVNELDGSGPAGVRICDLSDRSYHSSDVSDVSVEYEITSSRSRVSYSGTAFLKGKKAAQFVVRFLVQDSDLTVTCEFGEEEPGFELMMVSVPLVSAGAGEGASLALTPWGGRLVDIEKSDPQEFVQMTHFPDMPLLAMIKQQKTAGIVNLGSLDDHIVSSVYEDEGEKRASVALDFTHRYGPQTNDLPSFRVTNRTDAFLTVFEAKGKHWWVNGAKMARAKIDTSIPPLYDDTLIYKLKLDQVDFEPSDVMTFDEAIDRVRRLHNYTAGVHQVAYLNGWQHKGHDTGFPDVFTCNERPGGLEKCREAIQAGSKYNAVISFHDNYDDAYTNSPAWDESIIATDENNDLKAGGLWAGGQAYIISPHKYFDGAKERLRKTLDMYGIRRTIHLDCYSMCAGRYDFDPENPAGFDRSAEAKNYLVRTFREMGVDVTSEGMCSAFVGNINYGWHFPDADDVLFSEEEQIPLLAFIYHGRTIGAGGVENDRHLLKHLLWGLPFCTDIRKRTDLASFIEKYYLLYVPFFQLMHRTMQSYESDGGRCTVRYDGNSCVTVDFDANTYEIVVDSAVIAKDYTVTCPMPQAGWIVYSKQGGEVEMALPENVESVRVAVLNEESPAPFEDYSFKDGAISLAAEPGKPYYVTSA